MQMFCVYSASYVSQRNMSVLNKYVAVITSRGDVDRGKFLNLML